jgi:hypothetical protein
MEELKIPVSTTIEYADGSKTIINYNPLGEKTDEVKVPKETKVKVKVKK